MLTLSHGMAVLIGIALALWLAAAAWAVVTGLQMRRKAQSASQQADRLASLLDSAPALPIVVKGDGRIEAPDRLADWFGLPKMPNFLTDLSTPGGGLTDEDAGALVKDTSAVQKTGRSFARACRPRGSSRTLLIKGAPASSRLASNNAVILWVFDATDSQAEIGRLGEEVLRLGTAFERLSGLIEAAPLPMWHRGPDLRLALVNRAYVRAVEAEDAAQVIERQIELVDAAGEANPVSAARSAQKNGAATSRVVPVTLTGERRAMRVVDVPLDEAGVAGYALDVEEAERARAAFRRFAESQRSTLDRLSAGVAQFAADRSLVYCNQPFQRMFAMRPEWVAEQPNFDRLLDRMRETGRVPEMRDFPAWKAERRQWFLSAEGATEENWLVPPGMHLRLVVQTLPDGGLMLVFEDRTEQAQLSSARDILLRVRAAMFDNLFEAVGVFESDGRLHLWNNRFRQIWDFDEEFLATHPHVDALAEAAAAQLSNPGRAALIRELVRSATVERTQRSGRISLKSGRHFEFAAVPLPDGNALLAMLDITDSRKIERVLRERADALEDADRVKTAFLANMSYELRTPLTSISGFAEMLEQGFGGALDEAGKSYAGAIVESSDKLARLIDRVLDLTQAEGALPMERKHVELAVLLHDAARDHKGVADAKGIDFAVQIDPEVGALSGDGRRLRQAIDQLLDNALAFTPKGGRVLLHAAGDAREGRIVVSDNGPGMDPAAQAAALNPFSKLGDARVSRQSDETLGIGLPLARQFVEAHGGTLTLYSEPGEGTMVSIMLPR